MVNNNKQYFWLFSLVICMELFVFNFFLWLACAQIRPKIVFFIYYLRYHFATH